MSRSLSARAHAALLRLAERLRSDTGQGTVEYVGLAMAIGVLLLTVGGYLGKDHGIGSIITGAIKSALQHAAGSSGG
jgi:hypothetical protein